MVPETCQNFGSEKGSKSGHDRTEDIYSRERQGFFKREQTPFIHGRPYETSMIPEVQTMGNPKNFPKTNAYPTFGAGLDEDWADFIDEIDTLQEAYTLPDAEIVSKFPSLLKDNARTWYKTIHRGKGGRTGYIGKK